MGFGTAARLAARLPNACASSSQRRATQRAQIAALRARQPLSKPWAAPCGALPALREAAARAAGAPSSSGSSVGALVLQLLHRHVRLCVRAVEVARQRILPGVRAHYRCDAWHARRRPANRAQQQSSLAWCVQRARIQQGCRDTGCAAGAADRRGACWQQRLALQTKHNVWASDHLQGRGPGAPDAHQQLPVEDRRPVRPGQAAQRARATGLAGGRRGVRRRERPCGRGRRRSAAAATGEQGVDDAVVGHHIALRLLVQLRAARARRSAQRSSAPHTAAVALSGPWGFRGPTDSMRRAPFAKASMAQRV